MFGALFQMLPVVAGAVIKSPKPKAFISLFLLITGIPTFIYSFIFGKFMLLGAFLTYTGILYTSFLMLYHLLKIKSFTPTPKGMKFSLVFLLLGATAGLCRVLSYYGYLPISDKVLYFHYTSLLFGWIGLLISSVSFQVVEMFFVAESYPKHFSENYPLLVSLSILLSIIGNFFSLPLLFLFFAYSFLTINERRKEVPLMSEVIPPERIKGNFYLHLVWVLLSIFAYLLDKGY